VKRLSPLHSDLILFVVLAITLAIIVLPSEILPGSYDDDGIYLLGARSIAEGNGYRAVHLPGEPFQTKDPKRPRLLHRRRALARGWRRRGHWASSGCSTAGTRISSPNSSGTLGRMNIVFQEKVADGLGQTNYRSGRIQAELVC
jgi:hypothetical protein